ncbi:uncharacterized protein LOC132701199 [Cylas formicarius]|uniref:uncharacterized protein LOC132701199 n=1 Tax=Cylas formicarius TaxID=197179 RepID=UPI0029583F92|nr:uncharacterized protein LOC132701199 [Cylas formicarius]
MHSLTFVILMVGVFCADALRLRGSIDNGAIVKGPAGIIKDKGNAAVGPIESPVFLDSDEDQDVDGPGLLVDARLVGLSDLTRNGGYQGNEDDGAGRGGNEGQYVPDLNEKHYDDGSYKPYQG